MAKTRSWEKGYNNLNELGEGGNAKVYHVQCKDNDKEYVFRRLSKETIDGFFNSINIHIYHRLINLPFHLLHLLR